VYLVHLLSPDEILHPIRQTLVLDVYIQPSSDDLLSGHI